MICKHDINVFINRQLIYNYPEQLFADKGVMAIEHADFDGIERLALVTGGEIVSTFGKPELVKIGKCDLIEQVSIGDETLVKFRLDFFALILCEHYSKILCSIKDHSLIYSTIYF